MVGMTIIVGQQTATATLQKAISSGRTHHAWIFRGPSGVGKYTLATEFARCLIDSNLTAGDLGSVEGGTFSHPDLHIVRKEDAAWSNNPQLARRKQTNIPVDLLRERMIGGRTSDDKNHDAPAFKTSTSGGNKVFIIDEAELLDEIAQNSLLKTLEEPPIGTIIVLVTSRDDLLLPTIRSRSALANFSPLSNDDMYKWIRIASFDVAKNDIDWSVCFSGGSPGLVCLSLESNLPQLARDLDSFISGIGSGNSYQEASGMMIYFVDFFVKQMLNKNSLCSKEAANRQAFSVILQLLGMRVRELVNGNRNSLLLGIRGAAILSDVENQIRTNISVKVLLESLAARWVHLCRGDAMLMPL